MAAVGGRRLHRRQRRRVTITIHYSALRPDRARRSRAGVPITFVLVNEDPIDHEWLIGDAAFHDAHRNGTEAAHGDAPDRGHRAGAGDALETTLTFDEAGEFAFICHLPGHEAYGMVGLLTVEGLTARAYTPAVLRPNPPRLITVIIAVALILVGLSATVFPLDFVNEALAIVQGYHRARTSRSPTEVAWLFLLAGECAAHRRLAAARASDRWVDG